MCQAEFIAIVWNMRRRLNFKTQKNAIFPSTVIFFCFRQGSHTPKFTISDSNEEWKAWLLNKNNTSFCSIVHFAAQVKDKVYKSLFLTYKKKLPSSLSKMISMKTGKQQSLRGMTSLKISLMNLKRINGVKKIYGLSQCLQSAVYNFKNIDQHIIIYSSTKRSTIDGRSITPGPHFGKDLHAKTIEGILLCLTDVWTNSRKNSDCLRWPLWDSGRYNRGIELPLNSTRKSNGSLDDREEVEVILIREAVNTEAADRKDEKEEHNLKKELISNSRRAHRFHFRKLVARKKRNYLKFVMRGWDDERTKRIPVFLWRWCITKLIFSGFCVGEKNFTLTNGNEKSL